MKTEVGYGEREAWHVRRSREAEEGTKVLDKVLQGSPEAHCRSETAEHYAPSWSHLKVPGPPLDGSTHTLLSDMLGTWLTI